MVGPPLVGIISCRAPDSPRRRSPATSAAAGRRALSAEIDSAHFRRAVFGVQNHQARCSRRVASRHEDSISLRHASAHCSWRMWRLELQLDSWDLRSPCRVVDGRLLQAALDLRLLGRERVNGLVLSCCVRWNPGDAPGVQWAFGTTDPLDVRRDAAPRPQLHLGHACDRVLLLGRDVRPPRRQEDR